MKKGKLPFLAAVASAVFVLALSGCSERDHVIRFGWWGNPLRNTQTTAVLNMFGAEAGVHVEEFQAGFGDYWGMMQAQATAGGLPDVMQQDVAWLLSFQQSGLLVDLSPYIANGIIDVSNIPAVVLEQGRIGEGIYGIPIGMNVATMIYDRTLLDGLGLSAPRNMTLDQFMALSREIYARSGVRTNWASPDPINPLTAHLRAQGVQMFEPVPGGGWRMGGRPENYRQFFDVIATGIAEGWHMRLEAWDGRDRFAQSTDPLVFPSGAENANLRSWISIGWSNGIVGFQAVAPTGTELGMTTLPSANPQVSNFGRASMFLSVTANTRDRDMAARLVNFWLNSQAAHDIMLAERGVIPNTVIADAVYPRLSPGGQLQAEFVSWVNRPENSTPFFPLRPEGSSEFLGELSLVTDMVMAGQLTPAAAARRIFDFGNGVLR